jgi:general stress protein CsbA
MKNVSKTAILPVVTVILLAVGTVTNHKFTADTADFIATIGAVVITAGINVWGIIKNHKKEVK